MLFFFISTFRLDSVPKNSISALPVSSHPPPQRVSGDLPPLPVSKQIQMVPRGSQMYAPPQTDIFYPDPRGGGPSFEPVPYPPSKWLK